MCMCFALAVPASSTPANADALGGATITPGAFGSQVGAEAGMNQGHDMNHLRDQFQDKLREDDYQYYQQRKNLKKILMQEIRLSKITTAAQSSRLQLKN